VYGILATRSEFPAWDACNMSGGSSGYMQIQDLFMPGGDANIDNHYGYVGNAKFFTNADLDSTLSNGLCFIDETWKSDANDPTQGKYALGPDQVGTGDYGTAYPPGLPAPMAQKDASGKIVGWHAGPTKGKRLKDDFDLSKDRLTLLARFAPDGDLAKAGFQGVVFYDKAKGYVHQFSPLTYTTVYDNATSHITIPIREAEVKSYFNDPAHPNCVGKYKTDTLQPGGTPNCDDLQDPLKSSWGCKGTCPSGQDGPAVTEGYFIIPEIEQVYAAALGATLCVTYPTQAEVDKQGFYNATDKDCMTASWDPSKKDGSGIPKGDWCSATNSKATATCHDAFKSHSVHVFSGAKVKDAAQTCAP